MNYGDTTGFGRTDPFGWNVQIPTGMPVNFVGQQWPANHGTFGQQVPFGYNYNTLGQQIPFGYNNTFGQQIPYNHGLHGQQVPFNFNLNTGYGQQMPYTSTYGLQGQHVPYNYNPTLGTNPFVHQNVNNPAFNPVSNTGLQGATANLQGCTPFFQSWQNLCGAGFNNPTLGHHYGQGGINPQTWRSF